MKENDQTKLNHKTSQQIISEYDCYEVHIDNELVTYRSPTYKIDNNQITNIIFQTYQAEKLHFPTIQKLIYKEKIKKI